MIAILIKTTAVVLFALLLTLLCVFLIDLFFKIKDGKQETKPAVKTTNVEGIYAVRTIEHDGHLFVALSYNSIIHHPSCPCLK